MQHAFDTDVVIDLRPMDTDAVTDQLPMIALAIALQVPAPRINDVAREKRGVSADTALRLARYFGTSAEFWMGLQADYDLKISARELKAALKRIHPNRDLQSA